MKEWECCGNSGILGEEQIDVLVRWGDGGVLGIWGAVGRGGLEDHGGLDPLDLPTPCPHWSLPLPSPCWTSLGPSKPCFARHCEEMEAL